MMRYSVLLLALYLVSCQPAEEQGHAHDAAAERPAVQSTIWTDKTELFVEFPALVVGSTSRFAAHVTALEGHQPISAGSVTVSLIRGETGISHRVEAPDSPGIFTPSLQPKEAGLYQLVFELKTTGYSDRMVVHEVQVFASAEEATKALGGKVADNGAISFLKEQAWKMEFQTQTVLEQEIWEMISTSGVWQVAPSDYTTLVATASGRIAFNSDNLTEGSRVKKGQVLMTVSSAGLSQANLGAEIQNARAAFEQARSEWERKQQLYESRIIPKAEWEQVEQRYQVARTNYETLRAGYSAGGKQVIVPFDGYVKSVSVGNGAFVEQGAALLTVTSHQTSLLEARVSPSYAAKLANIQDVWYQPREGEWSSLRQTGGTLVSVGKEVERGKPLLSVFARVNEPVAMPEGSFTEVQLAVGTPLKAPVIPASALLEDYGTYSVIVQLSGERFERRPVTPGRRNGSDVAIKKGLSAGEIVVSKGAYGVKMAAMAGQAPGHGHGH
jgi:membrane fusion protein, heavy metal efflux system